jgi:hypothetical protein
MGLDDPPNYHFRRLTETGYPLMGSSPAEQEEARQRGERLRIQAMRNHPFTGDGTYCQHWSGSSSTGSSGTLSFKSQCGYGRSTHPEVPPDSVLPGNPADEGER